MKKHIIIVASHYPPHIGGIETYSQSLAKEFLERKYKVSVVTTNLSFAEFKTTEVPPPLARANPARTSATSLCRRRFQNNRRKY
jgi:glycosyltransferase involved in cell wall biosynthesis